MIEEVMQYRKTSGACGRDLMEDKTTTVLSPDTQLSGGDSGKDGHTIYKEISGNKLRFSTSPAVLGNVICAGRGKIHQ